MLSFWVFLYELHAPHHPPQPSEHIRFYNLFTADDERDAELMSARLQKSQWQMAKGSLKRRFTIIKFQAGDFRGMFLSATIWWHTYSSRVLFMSLRGRLMTSKIRY